MFQEAISRNTVAFLSYQCKRKTPNTIAFTSKTSEAMFYGPIEEFKRETTIQTSKTSEAMFYEPIAEFKNKNL